MPATVAPVTPLNNLRHTPSVDLLVSIALGVSPVTAHNYLYDPETGVFARAAKIARTLRLHGHRTLLARQSSTLLAELTDAPAPPDVRTALLAQEVADSIEGGEEAAYRQDPTPRNRDRYLDALRIAVETTNDLIRALEAEKAGESA